MHFLLKDPLCRTHTHRARRRGISYAGLTAAGFTSRSELQSAPLHAASHTHEPPLHTPFRLQSSSVAHPLTKGMAATATAASIQHVAPDHRVKTTAILHLLCYCKGQAGVKSCSQLHHKWIKIIFYLFIFNILIFNTYVYFCESETFGVVLFHNA